MLGSALTRRLTDEEKNRRAHERWIKAKCPIDLGNDHYAGWWDVDHGDGRGPVRDLGTAHRCRLPNGATPLMFGYCDITTGTRHVLHCADPLHIEASRHRCFVGRAATTGLSATAGGCPPDELATRSVDAVSDSPLLASFRQAKNYTKGPRNGPVELLVVHVMEYPEHLDAAEAVANFFANQKPGPSGSSAHVCIDPDSIVGCVHEADIAWHAPGANHNGLGAEFAGYARQTAAEWADPYSEAELVMASRWFADRAAAYRLPLEFRTAVDLLAGGERRRGITTHWEVTKAYHRGTHTDPGPNFPMAHFLELVRSAAGSPTTQEELMLIVTGSTGVTYVTNSQTKRTVTSQAEVDGWLKAGARDARGVLSAAAVDRIPLGD